MGQKPLFYTQQGDTFAFGSELSALSAHRLLQGHISQTALQKYFAYGYIPAPHSIFDEVKKLPGGHTLSFDIRNRRCDVRKYWDYVIDPFTHIPAKPEEVWCEQLRELLGAAVKRRLMSDVPLGVFLSGGIDSSAIAWYGQQAASTMKAGCPRSARRSSPPLSRPSWMNRWGTRRWCQPISSAARPAKT